MKYLKKYESFKSDHLNEEWSIDRNLKIPGIPDKFSTYEESHDVIMRIFKAFKIEVKISYNTDFDENEEFVVYCNYQINDSDNNIIKFFLMNTNTPNYSEFYIDEDDERGYYNEQVGKPIELIDYLFEIGLVSTIPWVKKLNESTEDDNIPDNDIIECENYIISVLDKLRIRYKKTGGSKSVFSDDGRKPYNFELLDVDYDIIIEEFVDEDTAEVVLIVFFKDKGDPYSLQEYYSTGSKYEFKDKLLKLHGIDISSVMKKLNEELTDDNIMKDPNTDHKEKEVLMNKNSLDDLNKYKSMKGRFDSIFSNLDEDIDSPTIFKLIDGNKFLKEYVSLLHKKRDLEVLKSLITDKEERLKELKKESQDLNLDSDSDPETKSSLKEQVTELISDINGSKNKISDYSDVPNLFQKWDNQIIKLTRDLKQGKSVLDSTLDDLR